VAANTPERQRRCRAAVASTFVGALELAREGMVMVTQGSFMAPIRIRAAESHAAEP